MYSAVSTAAYDPAKAKPWIWELRTGAASYEDLRTTDGERSLDEKLFDALLKAQSAQSAKGAHALVAEMGRRIDVEFKIGKEPTGRQLLHIIREFYEVEPEKKVFFEMRHLYEFKFWGRQTFARMGNPLG